MSRTGKRHTAPSEPPDDVMQRVCQLLERLESIVTSLLTILKQLFAMLEVDTDNRPSDPVAQTVQRRCGNDAAIGVKANPLEGEEPISFAAAAKLFPLPTPPHRATVSRWADGVRGIKLDAWRIAGRKVTSRQAVERFLLACREQDWAGMDANTGFYLERAMADKELGHDQQADDQPAQADHAQLSAQRDDSTKAARRKPGRKVATRRKSTPRQTKPPKNNS